MQLVRDWVEQLGLVAGSLQVLQSWEDPWSLDACSCAVSIAVRDVCQPLLGEQQRWRSLRAVLRWGSALVRGLHRRGDAYGCSTRCATSLTICSNAPLATVYFYSSRRDLLESQCAASMFGWRVATHYPMLLGSRMCDEAGALNVAGSDVFG